MSSTTVNKPQDPVLKRVWDEDPNHRRRNFIEKTIRKDGKKQSDASYHFHNQASRLDRMRDYYASNKERLKQKAKARYEANKENRKAQMREYNLRCKQDELNPTKRSPNDTGHPLSYSRKNRQGELKTAFLMPTTTQELGMTYEEWSKHLSSEEFGVYFRDK